jgi:hypothetical protein
MISMPWIFTMVNYNASAKWGEVFVKIKLFNLDYDADMIGRKKKGNLIINYFQLQYIGKL